MIYQSLSRVRINTNIAFITGFLLLTFISGTGFARTDVEPAELHRLVRIDIHGWSDIEKLAAAGLNIYAQLYSPQGDSYLLASIGSQQRDELKRLGFSPILLDPDSQDASYYLLYGLKDVLAESLSPFTILQTEGSQAVARLTVDEAARASGLDLMIMPLHLRPLVVPRGESVLALPSSITPRPLVQGIIAQIKSDRLSNLVGSLSGEWAVSVNNLPYTFSTRYTYTDVPIKKATRYTYEYFLSLGLPAGYSSYSLGDFEKRNVIAEQRGLTQPERLFLLVAHLDSYSQNPYNFAPGADDNASGSSGLMAIADILSQYEFGCTLRYVLFTGEEQGNIGSSDYAADVYQAGDNIEAVLNLDMLGYNTAGTAPTIELHTRPGNQNDLAIANLFAETISAYQINLDPMILQDGKSFSDHAAFWEYGFPAVLAIEDWTDHTPHYHKTSDRLETLTMSYYTEFVKAAIATMTHMGCLLEGELGGRVTDASNGDPIQGAVVRAALADGRYWWTNTQADGSYRLHLVPGDYTVLAAAPFYTSQTSVNIAVSHDQFLTMDHTLQPDEDGIAVYLPVLANEAP